jgi:hypothetical protein
MQFAHTWEKVLSGAKTQTRRIVKPGDDWGSWGPYRAVYNGADPNGIDGVPTWGRMRWRINQVLSVQPGRAQKGVARIRITDLRLEDVRKITDEDAAAEGFWDPDDFLVLWCQMHDPGVLPYFEAMYRRGALYRGADDRYQAWALTFELVKESVKVT